MEVGQSLVWDEADNSLMPRKALLVRSLRIIKGLAKFLCKFFARIKNSGTDTAYWRGQVPGPPDRPFAQG